MIERPVQCRDQRFTFEAIFIERRLTRDIDIAILPVHSRFMHIKHLREIPTGSPPMGR